MGQDQSKQKHHIDQKKIGFPFSNNKYWKMVRQGKTNQLLKQFQEGNIDCYQIVEENSNHTIVHQAIVLDRRELFKLCEVYGADWNQPDVNGVTPLMKAAGLNRQYYVERLIELGVKIDTRDRNGRSAIDFAALYGLHQIVERLEQINNVKDV